MPTFGQADRLLLVPDGPLFYLPFAALADPSTADRLIEGRPITTVASATVFALLKQRRQDRQRSTVVAFGDPVYRTEVTGFDQQQPELTRTGVRLRHLPATRRELQAIKKIFGDAAETHLGEAATEEKAREVIGGYSYVHFAAHGILNERFPLESAIVLSLPNQTAGADTDSNADRKVLHNGLLQAWEVFEDLRLDADLVTLSACETALGAEVAGEGILGITRAFLYAGAKTVLASLWPVADASTAVLMEHFYLGLDAGLSKDEALRQAQLKLLHATEEHRSHPAQWAGFELIGDWR